MRKGRLIAVEGRLQTRRYQTQEGQNRTVYEVQANEVRFLDKGSDGPAPPPSESDAPPQYKRDEPESQDYGEPPEPEGDDLPF